ncbi:MAG: Calx-beta proteinputative calcium-binding protein [Phycisphaerales bacterium]|nr:Calx-beta proteinputative calcium-binding protein [Phycisphaerales bacterium]
MSPPRRSIPSAATLEPLEARRMFDSNPTFNYVDAALSAGQLFQTQSGQLQNFLITDGGTGDQSTYQVRTFKFTPTAATQVRFLLSASNPVGTATKFSFSLYDDNHNGGGGTGGDGLLQETFDTPVAGLPQDVPASQTVTSSFVTLQAGETYFIRLLADGDFLQAGGNGAAAGVNYSFTMQQPGADLTPPTATLMTALRVRTVGGTFYKFVIRYYDRNSINLANVDSSDVIVTGPGGFSSGVRLLSKTAVSSRAVDAFYRLAARGGAWDRGDNGLYTITQVAGQVTDPAGNSAPAVDIGQFTVRIAKGAVAKPAAVPALAANTFSSTFVFDHNESAVWA